MDSNRRRLVSALAAAAPLSALEGCALFRPDPAELCERPNAADTGLLIDVHAHVFNGSDLQIADFIDKLDGYFDGVWEDALNHLGGFLQRVAWHRAPWGPAELRALSSVQCGGPSLARGATALREHAYQIAIETLDRAAEETRLAQAQGVVGRKAVFSPLAQSTLEALKRTSYEQYRLDRAERAAHRRAPAPSRGAAPAFVQKTLGSLYDFVIQHFQYRYANVVEYFQHYEARGRQPVDLLVTSFLDFDYWISCGRSTPTTIPQQIEVMERIGVLSGGRVHSFVPYCPLRDLETGGDEPGAMGESLKWVEDAITRRGFIGVKIYPPMGFAPYGNASAEKDNPGLWQKPWLPPRARKAGFGAELDRMLDTFYRWCLARDVPIMAHTSRTNIMHKDFEHLPGSKYWKMALELHPDLRVDFGHIGGNEDQGAPRAKAFIDLMGPAKEKSAVNAYADISYFFDVVDHPETLGPALRKLFAAEIARERMMYGSDYQMIVSEEGWAQYQEDFRNLIRRIGGGAAFESDFFGNNAARYLGLRVPAPGKENNRSRLETYYRDKRLPKPTWMSKVDNPPPGPR